MAQEMETFAARLASFDRVLYPGGRRSSLTPAEPIAWPHSRPSPAELAHAGFFYHPYETNPDNTICFLCRRALDGWEEEDNPITEHLKHAPDCGWAVMMDIQQHSSNPAEIEDPTSERIVQARQATFGEAWPHDGKRGWTCQSDKMVEGGWYFCPNEESNDLATCAYCKLSLDGWEPKDNPFDEHYRRSSDCSFFVFAQPPTTKKGKNSRSKKGRVSKAARLSTQSTVSEGPMQEVDDDSMDQSTMSQSTTKSKSSKKSTKSKSRSKKKDEQVEAGGQMDVDSTYQTQPEPPKAKRTRGKKRTSEDIAKDDTNLDAETDEKPEPPSKKRATKTRVSAQQPEHEEQPEAVTEEAPMEEIQEAKPKKSRGTSKKKTTLKSRNVTDDSSTTKAPASPEAPQDAEPGAVVENVMKLERASVKEPSEEPAPKPSKKSKSKKKVEQAPEPLYDTEEHSVEVEPQPVEEPEPHLSPEPQPPVQEPRQTRRSSKRQSARNSTTVKKEPQEEVTQSEAVEDQLPEPTAPDREQVDTKRHESFVSVEITTRVPSREPEAEVEEKNGKRKLKRKESTEKQKKSRKSAEEPVDALQEDRAASDIEETVLDMDGQTLLGPSEQEPQVQTPVQQTARRRSSRVPPKTVERYSDIPKEKQYATSLVESRNSGGRSISGNADPDDEDEQEQETVSPLPSPSKTTPSISPQSSDAENHPPSLKPTLKPPTSRLLVPSPSKQQSARIPFAASTPSPSKRAANTGSLSSTHPWTPVDIDSIILAGTSDKENIDFSDILNSTKGELSSQEEKMTVEEWIRWNAKNGEERLKRECERLVSQFEKEGARAMRVLEGIECMD